MPPEDGRERCAADPGAGSCPWAGTPRSAAPVSSSARPLAWLLLTWEGAKCYLGEEVQARTGPRAELHLNKKIAWDIQNSTLSPKASPTQRIEHLFHRS